MKRTPEFGPIVRRKAPITPLGSWSKPEHKRKRYGKCSALTWHTTIAWVGAMSDQTRRDLRCFLVVLWSKRAQSGMAIG